MLAKCLTLTYLIIQCGEVSELQDTDIFTGSYEIESDYQVQNKLNQSKLVTRRAPTKDFDTYLLKIKILLQYPPVDTGDA